MPLVSDAYIPGLSQPGPPPGANDDIFLVEAWYKKNSVAEVQQMHARELNEKRLLILTGLDSAFDGLLQGIYIYVPPGQVNTALSDDASYILIRGGAAWRKLT
jgi:hypothetical protein